MLKSKFDNTPLGGESVVRVFNQPKGFAPTRVTLELRDSGHIRLVGETIHTPNIIPWTIGEWEWYSGIAHLEILEEPYRNFIAVTANFSGTLPIELPLQITKGV